MRHLAGSMPNNHIQMSLQKCWRSFFMVRPLRLMKRLVYQNHPSTCKSFTRLSTA